MDAIAQALILVPEATIAAPVEEVDEELIEEESWGAESELTVTTTSEGDGKEISLSILDLRISSTALDTPAIYPVSDLTEEHLKAPFLTIPRGSPFSMGFSWRVSGATLSNFSCTVKIYRMGILVYRSRIRLGTFEPSDVPYLFFIKEQRGLKGRLADGLFRAKLIFSDKTARTLETLEYCFTFS